MKPAGVQLPEAYLYCKDVLSKIPLEHNWSTLNILCNVK